MALKLYARRSFLRMALRLAAVVWITVLTCDVLTAQEISATFSIVAVDPEQGLCGAAVASKYPAVGKVVPYVRGGVGAFCTQHYHVPAWGQPTLDRLAQGSDPAVILSELLSDDPMSELRQLALIDMQGRLALHNPTAAPPESRYWGAYAGRNFSVQGNTLAGRSVLVAMAAAFEQIEGSFADRLTASLVAGDRQGGDHRGRLAAGIVVARADKPEPWLELYVDESDDAVEQLLGDYRQLDHAARGEWSGELPRELPSEVGAGEPAAR